MRNKTIISKVKNTKIDYHLACRISDHLLKTNQAFCFVGGYGLISKEQCEEIREILEDIINATPGNCQACYEQENDIDAFNILIEQYEKKQKHFKVSR